MPSLLNLANVDAIFLRGDSFFSRQFLNVQDKNSETKVGETEESKKIL